MEVSSLIEAAQNVGKYTLIEKIGEGYLGPVYRGFDQDLGTPVVVRILCDGIKWDSRLEEAFNRESRAIASLRHPNLAAVLEVGREGQSRYIVMESLGSGTLQNLIVQHSAIPVETKLSIMIQISEGLSHAHKNGVLHRDLVPGKIHLTPDGNAKIRDFAIANVLMKYLPHPAVRWGAPIYLCPEQIQHQECDARSDIFSAGTIFYELLTQFHPFHDRDSNKALDNILSDAPISTFEKFPDAPPGIWTILRSCLAKNPEDRYRNADELAQACRELLISLAEDTQLVLSELYAALAPLRKAAAQPNAAPGTLSLLKEIQSLLRGEREADYAYLDRLMTILMEQYPAIQAAAGTPPTLDSICPQLQREEKGSAVAAEAEIVLPAPPPEKESTQLPEPAAAATKPPDKRTQGAIERESGAPLFGMGFEERPASLPESAFHLAAAPSSPEHPMKAGGQQPSEPFVPAEPEFDPVVPKMESEEATVAVTYPADTPPVTATMPIPDPGQAGVPQEAEAIRKPVPPTSLYRKTRRPSYRSTVILLSILVMAAAGYIILGTETAGPIWKAWNIRMPYSNSFLQAFIPTRWSQPAAKIPAATEAQGTQQEPKRNPSDVLLEEARALAAENRVEESRVLLHRILETDPGYQPALAALKETEERSVTTERSLEESVSRISALLNAGKLQSAKNEIDRLQQIYPDAAEISALRKRWQVLNAKQIQEQTRKEEDQQKANVRQKEDVWNRQLTEFFARGKYGEAAGALSLWLTEDPGSARAQDLTARLQEIQRHLKTYSSAMAENKYAEALNALSFAEKLNPTDPNLAELRHQIEARKAAARAMLTVHRLGAKANLLLDGRLIGKDGEVENEAISIGSHTLAIENGGGVIASRIQDYSEGQRVVLAYDLVRQNLRAMTEADREALAQRRAVEDVERFSLEHDHGVFRGSCRGVLSLNSLDVAYSPSSGSHGFRIPFKLLKLKTDGKAISLYYISDNSHFQTFRFQDSQTTDRFRQKWDELKALFR